MFKTNHELSFIFTSVSPCLPFLIPNVGADVIKTHRAAQMAWANGENRRRQLVEKDHTHSCQKRDQEDLEWGALESLKKNLIEILLSGTLSEIYSHPDMFICIRNTCQNKSNLIQNMKNGNNLSPTVTPPHIVLPVQLTQTSKYSTWARSYLDKCNWQHMPLKVIQMDSDEILGFVVIEIWQRNSCRIRKNVAWKVSSSGKFKQGK